MKCALTLII